MNFSNIRFLDAEASTSGSGLSPTEPIKNIPSSFIDDCLYIFRKYPSASVSPQLISPTGMSSTSNEEWTISSSTAPTYDKVYNAFDGDETTYYQTSAPCSIVIRNLSKKTYIKSYAITNYYSYMMINNKPLHWTLEGSDNGGSWTKIHEVTIPTSGEGSWSTEGIEKKIFDIPDNETSYFYYRINFDSETNPSYLAIGEIEFFDSLHASSGYYVLPAFASSTDKITNFAFVGCPEEGSIFWDYLSNETRNALIGAGWVNSGHKYASVLCNTVNEINFAVSSKCNVFLDGIEFLRKNDTTPFNTTEMGSTNRYMFYFSGGNDFFHIRNCRFSEKGVNLDDETYSNPKPGMKSCAYIYCSNLVNSLVFEDNVVNFIPQTQGSSSYIAYNGFIFSGRVINATVNNNEFYMSKSDNTSWIHQTNLTNSTNMYSKVCFCISGESTSDEEWQTSRFICFNNNRLTLRLNNYKNINGWVSFPSMEKIEFVGNRVVAGKDMGTYNYKEMNMPLFYSNLITIGPLSASGEMPSYSYCTDYLIKDFYADVPFIWGSYGASFMYIKFSDDSIVNSFRRVGYNRSSKRNIIDNITILLGDGPSISEISQSDLDKINAWNVNGSSLYSGQSPYSSALHLEGINTSTAYSNYIYCNHSNIAKNIIVSNPWGYALCSMYQYVEVENLRGYIRAGNSCYIKVKNMTIKKANENAFNIINYAQYIEVDNLNIEDKSIENYFGVPSSPSTSSGGYNFRVLINKTNHPITTNGSVIGTVNTYYNESLVIQKSIGENNIFMMKSINKFIESCDVTYNGINTLKMFGLYDHNRSLKLIDTGDTGLTSRHMLPGKYKIRINMAFNGSDLYASGQEGNSRSDVLNRNNLVIGIKTKNGEYGYPDSVGVGCNGEWNTDLVTPFYQEYYVNIYEEQYIYTTIERFNVYSSGFSVNGLTSAIYLSPLLEITKIGDVEFSNSNSESNGE